MKTRKTIFAILVLCAFSTFFWSTSATVIADVVQADQIKPASFYIMNQGYVDKVIHKVITQEELMVEAARAGEIDMVGQFVTVQLLRPEDYTDPNLELTQTRRRGFGHITFHTQKFPTSVRGLRQGFAYALDKVELQQRALAGASYVADSPIVASLGLWSCEYEYASEPCSPEGDSYYDPRPDLGNKSILESGFYDYDGDGWREFFVGEISDGVETIWNGSAVYDDMSQRYATNQKWDGYAWNTIEHGRVTFDEVNQILGGTKLGSSDAGSDKLVSELKNSANWEEVSFTVTGSSNSGVVGTVITMTAEAFETIGIQAESRFVAFATLLDELEAGEFNAVFFAYGNLAPNPTFMESFSSTSESNRIRSRWYNTTFDQYWEVIDNSSSFDDVLEAGYKAQQMYWQEQPMVVMYNNELTSLYRKDKFEGQITVPGTGAFGTISVVKTHLKWYEGVYDDYPNWPLGGTLIYGLPQEMDSKNTIESSNAYTMQVMGLIEEALFGRHPEDLQFIGQMVSEWDIGAPCNTQDCIDAGVVNGSKFTFHLLDNMTWHDGITPVTADDVAFSFQMLQDEVSTVFYDSLTNIPTHQIRTGPGSADYQNRMVIDVVNNYTVTIYSKSAGLFEFDNTGIPIYQKSIWGELDEPKNYQNDVPRGCGPYKWSSSSPGEFYTVTRNEEYYYRPYPIPDYTGPDTSDTSNSTDTSSGIDTTDSSSGVNEANSPGFEYLIASAGLFVASTVVIKRRKS